MQNKIKITNTLPTSTAHQSRLQLFQPTRRPKNGTWVTETAWGSAKIHGRIGQGHADILESIFFNAATHKILTDGSMQILVDPHLVRRTAGGNKLSGTQLDKLSTELMQVVIETFTNKTNLKIKGHIIDRIVESNFIAKTRNGAIGIDRKMWRVDIPKEFVLLMKSDIDLRYDPFPIALLTSGITAAIVRHVKSHRYDPNGGWTLDKLIEAVGGGKTPKSLRDHRADVKNEKKGLEKNGICLSEGRLFRIKQNLSDAHIPGEAAFLP